MFSNGNVELVSKGDCKQWRSSFKCQHSKNCDSNAKHLNQFMEMLQFYYLEFKLRMFVGIITVNLHETQLVF
ncbi:hypothetical protein LguiB_021328 [Lonicera macranthoides]